MLQGLVMSSPKNRKMKTYCMIDSYTLIGVGDQEGFLEER
jgi:hypothetical protein